MTSRILVTIATLTFLAACGGGGGGSPTTDAPAPQPPPTADPMPTSQSAFTSDPATTHDALGNAATARPAFGSVTQSSSVNVSGVSTDAAQVTRQGSTVALRVRRQNGGSFSLNTAQHLVEASAVSVSPVTGRAWQDGILFDYTSNSLTVMRGAIDYSSTDVTDWMAGGYWLHVRGDWANAHVSAVEVGAFVDGPEISGPANVPLTGTATYNGIAAGLYGLEAASDVSGVPAGTVELGEYDGVFRARADFGRGTVSASITNIYVDAIAITPDGTVYDASGSSASQLHFGAAPISSNGTFTGTSVTATDPRFSSLRAQGSWGGRFSTIDDASGDPRLLAGTHGGTVTTPGGTEVQFIGAHFGATPDF